MFAPRVSRLQAAWRQTCPPDDWLDAIPGSRLVITKASGHGIPLEEPELIVKTIRELVECWRALNPY